MRLLKHFTQQPFVFATGLAALVHSTWSLGTLFAGQEPPQFTVTWFAWLSPALLIAFALDIGQIVTSAEIRSGQRTRVKYATFSCFAVATYYLQWLYIAHHMPNLALAAGVREEWYGAATLLRDAAIWFIPALLPLSTLLYTFSHSSPSQLASKPDVPTAGQIESPKPDVSMAVQIVGDNKVYPFTCEDCGDFIGVYPSGIAKAQAKRAHGKHCTGKLPAPNHDHVAVLDE